MAPSLQANRAAPVHPCTKKRAVGNQFSFASFGAATKSRTMNSPLTLASHYPYARHKGHCRGRELASFRVCIRRPAISLLSSLHPPRLQNLCADRFCVCRVGAQKKYRQDLDKILTKLRLSNTIDIVAPAEGRMAVTRSDREADSMSPEGQGRFTLFISGCGAMGSSTFNRDHFGASTATLGFFLEPSGRPRLGLGGT